MYVHTGIVSTILCLVNYVGWAGGGGALHCIALVPCHDQCSATLGKLVSCHACVTKKYPVYTVNVKNKGAMQWIFISWNMIKPQK